MALFRRRARPDPVVLDGNGVFRVDLPTGWSVTRTPPQFYEASPPPGGPDVSVSISVHPLSDTVLATGTVGSIQLFATVGGVPPKDFSATTSPDSGGERAFGRWTADGRTWFCGAMFMNGCHVIASSNCPQGDSVTYRVGEQIVAAIRPAFRPSVD